MRIILVAISASALLLTACGNKSSNEASRGLAILDEGRVVNAPPPIQAKTTHFCPSPVQNGSDAQSACFEQARVTCPQGTKPKQVIFNETGGRSFQIKGYGCS